MKLRTKRLSLWALGVSAIFLVSAGNASLADNRGGWHHGGKGYTKMSREFQRRYDANKDGEVTQEEIDTNRVARHGKYDANADGKLSLEEFQGLWMEAYRRKMVREFQEFDVDGDAVVTLEEYTEPMSDFIERRKSRHGKHRGSSGRSEKTKAPE